MSAGSEYVEANGTVSLSATQAENLDLVCDRFEAAWKARRHPKIEEHLAWAPGPLRLAFLREFREPTQIAQDTDLDPLRSRPDFRLLILDLNFPTDPFRKTR